MLKKLFRIYITSNFHVALAVVAFTGITVMEFDLDVPDLLWLFNFLGTYLAYNFIKTPRFNWRDKKQRNRSFLFLLLLFILIVCLFFLPLRDFLFSALLGVLTLLYILPFRTRSLREIKGLKIFVVALVWAGVTVLMPIESFLREFNFNMWLSFFQRILMVLILILPFELRDVQSDPKSLGTFPQILGRRLTKGFAVLLSMGLIGLEILKQNKNLLFTASFFVFVFAALLAVLLARKQQPSYYASFWVEALPIFWSLGLYVIKILV